MKSKDLLGMELKEQLTLALKGEDESAIAMAFAEFAESMQAEVLADMKTYQATMDATILTRRGIHQLTADENKFYMGIIEAMNTGNPSMAFAGIETALPETVIDNVLAEMRANHPLLSAIQFQNTTAITKIIINKQGAQLAVWGPLNSEITKELSGAIGAMDLTLAKLSAFMPISKDMLVAGPAWIDSYVRATLSEAIALATETAIVSGTGKDQPIGMDRDVSDGVTVTAGVYPKKEAVAITDLSVKTYGTLLEKLAQGPLGMRPISEVILVVSPRDYFTKIFPASTVKAPDGTYNRNVFPFPTTVIQSAALEANEAIIGLANKYFMGIGAGSNGGKVEYSDEFRFLEDQRVYLTKMYGNGRPLDNNAFIRLDIAALAAEVLEVRVKGVVATKEQA